MELKECIVVYSNGLPVAIYGIRHFDSQTFLSFRQECKNNAEKLENEQKHKEETLLAKLGELEAKIEKLEKEIAFDRGEITEEEL